MIYKRILKPLLFKADPENAHEAAIAFAEQTQNSKFLSNIAQKLYGESNEGLEREVFGLKFPNPVGLAAGFDKNGKICEAMQLLGFGFVEVGSITARPSEGNQKPRAFRLPDDRSLINRMGLNNDGAFVIAKRISSLNLKIPLGVNIAKTNDSRIYGDAALQDYLYSYEKACSAADYVTVNISCPNTGEGKTFEDPAALRELLETLKPAVQNVPTLVKLTVDLDKPLLEKLLKVSLDFGIKGFVAANTSSFRENLLTDATVLKEIGNGGLSGMAIRQKSTQVIKWIREMAGEKIPVIGVGGIDSADAALEKLRAGADLIQVYTGLIYEGPSLVRNIKKALKQHHL